MIHDKGILGILRALLLKERDGAVVIHVVKLLETFARDGVIRLDAKRQMRGRLRGLRRTHTPAGGMNFRRKGSANSSGISAGQGRSARLQRSRKQQKSEGQDQGNRRSGGERLQRRIRDNWRRVHPARPYFIRTFPGRKAWPRLHKNRLPAWYVKYCVPPPSTSVPPK